MYREALSIPVLANGNILYFEDIQQCIEETGVDGVMIAEANLYNPTILSEMFYPVTYIGKEYLTICKQDPTSATLPMIRAHMFKIFKPCLSTYTDIRERFAHARALNDLLQICSDLEDYLVVHFFNSLFLERFWTFGTQTQNTV
jgi:tRNA-dihydrouridine synthase 1